MLRPIVRARDAGRGDGIAVRAGDTIRAVDVIRQAFNRLKFELGFA